MVNPSDSSTIVIAYKYHGRKETKGSYFNSKSKEIEKRLAMLKKHQTFRNKTKIK
jgi:hypothetical protein